MTAKRQPLIRFRPYQREVFRDRATGILLMIWGRQTGKSFTLAAWAVDRLLTRPGRLVTILSNSRDNGQELNLKCREICERLGAAYEQQDLSMDVSYEHMNMETRVTVGGQTGRVKVLAANPRTARGFSGDLVLDEFDWQEDQRGIWEAAEPILSSNPDYLCRIATTLNGKRMAWEMLHSGRFKVSFVTRSIAWKQGLKIYHPLTRAEITPDEARALALDKRAYDQNYENQPGNETTVLLTHDLIAAAEREDSGEICEDDWSPAALERLASAQGDVFVGVDVGRRVDWTVIAVLERIGPELFLRALLRLRGVRLPDQQRLLEDALRARNFRRAWLDVTGIGLGLVEYTQERFGGSRVVGINFSSSVPADTRFAASGRKAARVPITEQMALNLLQAYEDGRLRQPPDPLLRDDLRKPEKVITPTGRVSIAASSDAQGHADHFWAMALAVSAARHSAGPFAWASVPARGRASAAAPSGGAERARAREFAFSTRPCCLV
jgi:phage FluMu gp28-like protein